MIKFVPVDDILTIRNEVLRDNRLTLDECRWSSDLLPDTFHLGYYVDDELACIASFHVQSYGTFEGKGYQLRGMATIDKYRGQGIGNQLLNFALTHLRGQKANYLWANARTKAISFYKSLGFEVISDEFEVPVIGPHYVIYLKIQ
jgi:GNAT superfamily N-acetyltransferase